jgi:hypothetical protein
MKSLELKLESEPKIYEPCLENPSSAKKKKEKKKKKKSVELKQ